MKDILSREHARIVADMEAAQAPGPHAKEGEAYEPQRARIKAHEKTIDDERKSERVRSGFITKTA